MKSGFSLLELVFSIVVIGIIASFAIPKYMHTRDTALASTIKRDIITTITSVQTHFLINRKIDSISDAITLNETNWDISEKKIIFNEENTPCATLEIEDRVIHLTVDSGAGSVCQSLVDLNVTTQNFDLI